MLGSYLSPNSAATAGCAMETLIGGEMGSIRWPARSFGFWQSLASLTLVLHLGAAAAADPASPALPPSPSAMQSVPSPSAEADADTYNGCMKLAREDPHAA